MAFNSPTVGSILDAKVDDFHSPDDEMVIMEGLLSYGCKNEIAGLMDILSPDDFWNPTIQRAWSKAKDLKDSGKLISQRNLREGADDNLRRLIQATAGRVADPVYVRKAGHIVRELSKRRRGITVISDAAEFFSSDTSLAELKSFMLSAIEGMDDDDSKSRDAIKSYLDAVDEWWEWVQAPPEEVRIFPTPWSDVNDKLSGGLHSGRTYIIAARPGFGKSLALSNIVQHIAEAGHPSLLYSVEMKSKEVVSRLMSSGANVEYGRITKRDLNNDDLHRLGLYMDGRVPETKLWIADDPRMTIEEIFSKARELKRKDGLDVVALDYIQIMRASDKRESRERQIAHLSRMTQILAKSLDVAVVFAAQLNRGSVAEGAVPELSHLRESDSLGMDADVVIMIHHEEDMPGVQPAEVQFHFVKNRTGPMGAIIPIAWRPWYASLGA